MTVTCEECHPGSLVFRLPVSARIAPGPASSEHERGMMPGTRFGALMVAAALLLAISPALAQVPEPWQLGFSVDPFLMAVAIGASCDFLTPIGHQNNTLILGPGGYRFGDFWRVGLPLDLVVVLVAVAVIPIVWPF